VAADVSGPPCYATRRDGRVDWRGTFSPNGASPVNAGEATIEVGGRSASVLVQDWRFDGTRGTAVLLGQDEPPF
jgi:hypothetical protein